MACKLFAGQSLQREDPIGSGSGWTTADLASVTVGSILAIRNRFIAVGGGDGCTAIMDWYVRVDGGSWVLFATSKNCVAGTYYGTSSPAFSEPGSVVELQVRTTYDSVVHTSATITVTVASEVPAASAEVEVPGSAETIGVPESAMEIEVPGFEISVGVATAELEVEVPGDTLTVGVSYGS